MHIDVVDSRYIVMCIYVQYEAAAMSSRSCAEGTGDE